MRAILLLSLISAFLGHSTDAQELPEAAADRVSRGTVTVRPPKGAAAVSGAGFLVKRSDGHCFVLTSADAVGLAAQVEVVFGSGCPDQRILTADVIAVDPVRGLATVDLGGAAGLPEPLPLVQKTELKETETVHVAGFPGLESASASEHPQLRILKTNVSSFRRDEFNRLIAVQMAGDVTPGDFGGPVADRSGRAVGLVAGKIQDTQTAFAVPPETIHAFLAGDWVRVELKPVAIQDAKVKFEVSVDMTNPVGTLRSVTLAWGRKDKCMGPKEPLPPDKDGNHVKSYAATRELSLRAKDGRWIGTLEVDRLRPGEPQTSLLIQVKVADGGGKSRWCAAWELDAYFDERRVSFVESPSKAIYVAPPGGSDAPVELKLERFQAGPDCVERGRLERAGVLSSLTLSADGSTLYALDLTEGLILRIDTKDFRITRELSVSAHTRKMVATQDGKFLWLCGSSPNPSSRRGERGGFLQRIRLPDLEFEPLIPIDRVADDLVVTDAGIAILLERDAISMFDTARRSQVAWHGGIARCLALHPEQRVAYSWGGSPGMFEGSPICATPAGNNLSWGAQERVQNPGLQLAVSQDGKWIVSSAGVAASLGGSRSTDFRSITKLPPGMSVTIGTGTSTVFSCDFSGKLRLHDLGTFVLAREYSLPCVLREMVFDPRSGRLFGHAIPAPRGISQQTALQQGLSRPAGDLVVFDLSDP